MRKATKTKTARKPKRLKKLFEIETRDQWVSHHAEVMRRKEEAHYQQRYAHAMHLLQTAINEMVVCIAHEKVTKERNAKLRKFLQNNIIDTRLAIDKLGRRPHLVRILGGVLKTIRTIK